MYLEYKVEGGDFTNAGYASSQVKKNLKEIGIDSAIIKRVVISLYEAEVNVVAHAYRGVIKINIEKSGIEMILEDEGPGIENVDLAMKKGFSTASPEVREMGFGAGMGLPNINDNSDRFFIETEIGTGTKLNIFISFI